MRMVRSRKFPDETRFAEAGLADHHGRLPLSGSGALERLRELLELAVPPDEAGQTACGAGLEAGAARNNPRQLVDRRRSLDALHGNGPERFHLDITFG